MSTTEPEVPAEPDPDEPEITEEDFGDSGEDVEDE